MKTAVNISGAIFIALLFLFRDAMCASWFPNMKTDQNDWDGANTATMNAFAGVIALCLLLSTLNTTGIARLVLSIAFAFSLSDCLDRLHRIYEFTPIDEFITIPFCLLIPFCIFYGERKGVVQ